MSNPNGHGGRRPGAGRPKSKSRLLREAAEQLLRDLPFLRRLTEIERHLRLTEMPQAPRPSRRTRWVRERGEAQQKSMAGQQVWPSRLLQTMKILAGYVPNGKIHLGGQHYSPGFGTSSGRGLWETEPSV